jgi:hypothetical protein
MSDIVKDLREAAEQFHEGSGHEVRLRVAAAEIERLRAALLTCSKLASGQHHAIPSDRCAAICCHVDTVINEAARAAGGGDHESQ